jgi:murein DD-endopeptidase MepM/ murein hydrolase activator NlpD
MYAALAAILFFSLLLLVGLGALELACAFAPQGWPRRWWSRHRHRTLLFYAFWFGCYASFIAFGTGPDDISVYPSRASSPYKLPWRAGVTRLVAQGNRSFASHRGGHLRAWDFWMSIGTDVLAARDGKVVEMEDTLDGIGLRSNFVTIKHDDDTRAIYAHIRRGGAVVKVGDGVRQGQVIASSGMVGQTLFPHLHFVVMNREGTASVPISFADVPGGVPRAGRCYTSENIPLR